MKENYSSYIGTKDPIGITHRYRKTKHDKWQNRKFYQVNMCFGDDFKITARQNAIISRNEAVKVAKYLQKHGAEIVAAAKAEM